MKVELEPGKYAVAVSGGVDSVALLDMASKLPEAELVVAHFDHGIREDSAKDREFVRGLAKRYGLKFEAAEGRLGPDASEEKARAARYQFLKSIQKKHGAKAIVTAHHRDDMLETAIINLLRGTGPRGLSSLRSRPGVLRPFLNRTKAEIIDYARENNLKWREDPTNLDQRYLRNYIRHSVLPKISAAQRKKLGQIIDKSGIETDEIESLAGSLLDTSIDGDRVSREWVASLPHTVARELLAHWLRSRGIAFDGRTLERLSVSLKTLKKGKKVDISQGWVFAVGEHTIRLERV